MTMTYQQVKGLSKPKLVETLREALKAFKTSDKKLNAKAVYFNKTSDVDLKKVDKSVLVEALCSFLGIKPDVAVENQVKPAATKKEEPKVIPEEQLTSKSLIRAKIFPDKVTNDRLSAVGIDHLTIAPDIAIDEIINHVKNGDMVFIAQYWTVSHIQQYDYYGTTLRPATYKAFPNDLDLLMVSIVTTEEPDEKGKVNLDDTNLLAMSVYTQAFRNVQAKTLKNVADGIRYDNGCEYQVYLGVTSTDEKPDEEPQQEPVEEKQPEIKTPETENTPNEKPAEPPKKTETPKPSLNKNKKSGKKK